MIDPSWEARGYVTVYDTPIVARFGGMRADVGAVCYEPGSVRWGTNCTINLEHEDDRRLGSIYENSLAIWKDTIGVAFLLQIPVTGRGAGLRNALSDPRAYWGASIGCRIYEREFVDSRELVELAREIDASIRADCSWFRARENESAAEWSDGCQYERVLDAFMDHVAITYDPALVATQCWLGSTPLHAMAEDTRALARAWDRSYRMHRGG